jgi:hypothetical protein
MKILYFFFYICKSFLPAFKPIVSNLIPNLRSVDNITLMVQVYMLSLSSQPVDHEEPGKQMVLGDQVSPGILEQSMGARNRVGIGLSYRPARAGIFKQSVGAGNRVGIGLSYRPARAAIFKQSMGARNRVGIGLSYRPARLLRLAESIP